MFLVCYRDYGEIKYGIFRTLEIIDTELASSVFKKVYIVDILKAEKENTDILTNIRPFLFEFEYKEAHVIYYDKYGFGGR